MGSSLSSSQWLLLAIASGIFYLIFDAARHFVFLLGPVRLRSWEDHDPEAHHRQGRWFRFDSVEFSLISGAVLQFGLVVAVGSTIFSLWDRGPVNAVLRSAALWGAVVVGWKFVLAFIPDNAAEKILRAILPLSHVTYYLFWPVLGPLAWLYSHLTERREEEEEEEATEEEVQAYIDVGEEEGIFEEGEGKLVQSIVDFGDTVVREVMTPRIDMVVFDGKRPLDELAALFAESKYSRIPVYEGTIDKIAGVVHVKDLFDALLRREQGTILGLARPPYFIPESKSLMDLLREFQLEHQQIAIVHDEYGGTAGLVTVEDLVEEIVGEIGDEHEESQEEEAVKIEDDVYLVNGLLRVEKLGEIFGIELAGEGYETVAGLIFTSVGRVPRAGETVRVRGVLLEVERADRRRIFRVKATRDPLWAPGAEEDDTNGRQGRFDRNRA